MKPFEVSKAMIVAALTLLSVHGAQAGEYMGYRLAALKTLPMVAFVEAPEGGKRVEYVAEHVSPHVLPPATIETPDTRLASSIAERSQDISLHNPLVVRVYDRFVVANIVGPLSYYDLYNQDGSRKQRRELNYFGIDISRQGDASLVV